MVNILQTVVNVGKYTYTVPKSFAPLVKQQHVFDRYFDNFGSFKNALKFVSDEFRTKTDEALYAIKENGEMKYKIEGSKYAVAIPDQIDLKGLISVHNHPSVGSFSDTDIETACHSGLKKTIVVDKKYRYTMQPSNGKIFSSDMWGKIKNSFKDTYIKTRAELNQGRSRGQISEQDYEEKLDHLVWQRISESCGLKYTKEKYIPHSDQYVLDTM